MRAWRASIDGGDEPIAAPWKRLDEPLCRRRLAERFAKPFDRRVQAVFEVDESVLGPELATQIVARHKGPGLTDQQSENAKRLLRQQEPVPFFISSPDCRSSARSPKRTTADVRNRWHR